MIKGTLKKMLAHLDEQQQVNYQLAVNVPAINSNGAKTFEQSVALNPLIGKAITLVHTGNIYCSNCQVKTKKSYSQGHCYNCMRKLASCDMCILKPETCHYHQGTCREPQWGEQHCFMPHYVYLSNTSGIKVGITRKTQLPTRWIDQGATQGLVLFEVKSRLISGLVEIELAKLIQDKTNWRTMLKGNNQNVDLKDSARELIKAITPALEAILHTHGEDAITAVDDTIQSIHYPVELFPNKIASHNFDKIPTVTGILQGVKGQYLLFDTGVINIRKFSSYEVEIHS